MSVIEKKRYLEISLKEMRQGHCAGCGERTRKTVRVWQTRNPWNLNKHGRLKTETEIRLELMEEIARWRRKPLYCRRCESVINEEKT